MLILNGANLRKADLTGANIYGANLQDADLTGAIMPDGEVYKPDRFSGRNR